MSKKHTYHPTFMRIFNVLFNRSSYAIRIATYRIIMLAFLLAGNGLCISTRLMSASACSLGTARNGQPTHNNDDEYEKEKKRRETKRLVSKAWRENSAQQQKATDAQIASLEESNKRLTIALQEALQEATQRAAGAEQAQAQSASLGRSRRRCRRNWQQRRRTSE